MTHTEADLEKRYDAIEQRFRDRGPSKASLERLQELNTLLPDGLLETLCRVRGWNLDGLSRAEFIRVKIAMQNDPLFLQMRAGLNSTRSSGTPSPTPVLMADVERCAIFYNGNAYPIRSENAVRWVKVLHANLGRRIPARELHDHDEYLNGARPQDFKAFLPQKISKLIDTTSGHNGGSRLTLPPRVGRTKTAG